LHSFPDRSHHTEALTIRELVRGQIANFVNEGVPEDVSRDISRVLAMTPDIQQSPSRWRALYACDAQHVASEFDLPSPTSAARLEIGRHFSLLPLLRAMHSCRQYWVVLIESGKARVFHVAGTEICELPDNVPQIALTPRSEDSRVGWSKHIDNNLKYQEQRWFRMLAEELYRLTKDHGPGTLILGCREDMWGELRPYLADVESALMGSFHLPGFEISADSVLKHALSIFKNYEQERYKARLHTISEGLERSVSGLTEVLECLNVGRVQQLLLGELGRQTVLECSRCGHFQQEPTSHCTVCSEFALLPTRADECLIRLALKHKADILISPSGEELSPSVAAILHY
jgi:peptide subunit release factor 1 (eRF1)